MMQMFELERTDMEGLILIHPFYNDDKRGYFLKDYSIDEYQKMGLDYPIREIFYSRSSAGVLRGLHFQCGKPQSKLVRCVSGHIFDVVVDLRKNSKTFKQWKAFDLKESNPVSILIPFGFAHGFYAIEDSIVSYKCDNCFFSSGDSGIIWNDLDIGIDWPFDSDPIISDKDRNLQSFRKFMFMFNESV